MSPERVGVTGHQSLSPATSEMLEPILRAKLFTWGHVVGVTSLAAGADQLFALCVLDAGGRLLVVIPSENYEASFSKPSELAAFRRLRALASEEVLLPFSAPAEDAFWAAGREVVERSDRLLAIWDGLPAAGLGGTADVVRYARAAGKDVEVIWPAGAARE